MGHTMWLAVPRGAASPAETSARDPVPMAHSLSAKKRIRQNVKARARNRWRKGRIREAMKQYRETILHGSVEQAEQELSGLYKMLDQVGSTSTMHKKTASRYKSRLAAKLNHKRESASAAA